MSQMTADHCSSVASPDKHVFPKGFSHRGSRQTCFLALYWDLLSNVYDNSFFLTSERSCSIPDSLAKDDLPNDIKRWHRSSVVCRRLPPMEQSVSVEENCSWLFKQKHTCSNPKLEPKRLRITMLIFIRYTDCWASSTEMAHAICT